jgi:hypothetical protein
MFELVAALIFSTAHFQARNRSHQLYLTAGFSKFFSGASE